MQFCRMTILKGDIIRAIKKEIGYFLFKKDTK